MEVLILILKTFWGGVVCNFWFISVVILNCIPLIIVKTVGSKKTN